MKKIAFVTSSESPEIAADDQILLAAMESFGMMGIAAPWDDPSIPWANFDLILVRSCWNYHLHPDRFEAWINVVAAKGIRMANHPQLILWNLNKHYLKELNAEGVAIPDSLFIQKHDFHPDKLHHILFEKKWSRAVLKPCVSASSFRTSVITTVNASEHGNRLYESFPKGGMIVQEFVDAIPQRGEISMMFFNGSYSHAVIKEATAGEFRVQYQFGGSARPIEADKKTIDAAERIISKLPVQPLYARVDGFDADGVFTLMELELIEPVLFFNHFPDAAGMLTMQIEKLL